MGLRIGGCFAILVVQNVFFTKQILMELMNRSYVDIDMNKLSYFGNRESLCWLISLTVLFFINPENQQHFTLCPLKNLGINYCPGCGLGRSISFFLHGDMRASFQAHVLGIPAFFIIVHRIYSIYQHKKKLLKYSTHRKYSFFSNRDPKQRRKT